MLAAKQRGLNPQEVEEESDYTFFSDDDYVSESIIVNFEKPPIFDKDVSDDDSKSYKNVVSMCEINLEYGLRANLTGALTRRPQNILLDCSSFHSSPQLLIHHEREATLTGPSSDRSAERRKDEKEKVPFVRNKRSRAGEMDDVSIEEVYESAILIALIVGERASITISEKTSGSSFPELFQS
ncbi:hypothetical protein LWI28_011032 [Acer negundo]|uniref:Uncharacterized protein n=1 Tax=Acer negundo TaxID=4023 RepID=A0AAD5JNY7_ACENE|nr:hypothetical protein LWI28_011032 [Acer negundo]